MSQPKTAAPWSATELATLRALYASATSEKLLAVLPNRTWLAIRRAAAKHKLRRPTADRHIKWSEAELATLRRLYPTQGSLATCKALPRFTQQAVRQQACKLNLRVARQPLAPSPAKLAREAKAREKRLAKLLPPKPRPAVRKKATKKPAPVPKVRAPKPAPVQAAPVQGLHINLPSDTAKHRPEPSKALKPIKIVPSYKTPVADARQAAKRHTVTKPAGHVSADMIRALPAGHPARLAYTRAAYHGPVAAAEAFHAAMKQAA